MLGAARDAEVLAQRYQQALDELTPELVRGPVGERLVDGSLRRYQTGRRRSLAAMRSPRYFRLLDDLDDLVSAPAAERYATVDIAYRRLRKAVKAAKTAADHDAALHRIRKAAKRLRYAAAAADKTKIAQRAKTIQILLGDHQDSVVSRAHLIQQADAATAAGQDTFTYGLLYAREADLAAQCRGGVAARTAQTRPGGSVRLDEGADPMSRGGSRPDTTPKPAPRFSRFVRVAAAAIMQTPSARGAADVGLGADRQSPRHVRRDQYRRREPNPLASKDV